MGIEPGSRLLVEGRCTQHLRQLVSASPGVLSDGAMPTRPSQAVAGRPLMCESGDHVTLSRRCSVRVSSKVLACLFKVVALRTAYSSYLLHHGCSPTRAPRHANPPLTGGGRLIPDV